ncbi:cysteine-rich receptor-like protein kinase 10 [Nymphaea colorata]|nr:cysteine-rich receptor-like protein kinase 10 [Nymphaea colorata]
MSSEWKATVVLMVVAVVAMAAASGGVSDEQQVQDCITMLVPNLQGCLEALQDPTRKPSTDCCKGVSEVVRNQMKCLCVLYNSPSTVSSYGLNLTRLWEIPGICKVPADVSLCKTSSVSPPSSPRPSTALSPPSPASSTLAAATSAPPSNSSPTPLNEQGKSANGKLVFKRIVISSLIVILATCVICGLYCWKRGFCSFRRKKLKPGGFPWKEEEEALKHQAFKRADAMDGTLDLATVRSATEDFALRNKLGEGGFGVVYRGQLPDDREIAVKRLSRNTGKGSKQFINEVQALATLQHRNLVRLLGGLLEGEEKILVYEYAANGSLDNFLFGEEIMRMQLDWAARSTLINGIARGLLYLHEDSLLRIVHRDLKASNILLDKYMIPKISDFGNAKIFDTDQTQVDTLQIMGTRKKKKDIRRDKSRWKTFSLHPRVSPQE